VLRAFEQLAMSAPMQRAASEGRVRMYPVDLMRAASSVLQQQPEQAPPGFRSFRQDLADYLASSDYLTAFLHDSLHRADSLLGEATEHATGAAMARLEQQLAEVEDRLAFVTNERKRVGSALQLDWTQVCARTEQETTAEVERCARDAGAKLLRILGASIDTWFLSSQSLDWLVAQQWTPLVHDYREQVLAAAMRSFEQQQAQGDAGLDLPGGVRELLRGAGIDPQELKAKALTQLGNVVWSGLATVPVDAGEIPVRRGMLDLLAFRSLDRVRERLFGPASKPDTKIPGKDKADRLGEPGRLHLHQCVTRFRRELGPQTAAALLKFFGPDLRKAFETALRAQLSAYEPRLHQEQQGLEVHAVETAAALRAVLSMRAWALVCVDVDLPDARGAGFLRSLVAKEGAHAPALVALVRDDQDLFEARAAGISRVLRKPFDPAALLDLLARAGLSGGSR